MPKDEPWFHENKSHERRNLSMKKVSVFEELDKISKEELFILEGGGPAINSSSNVELVESANRIKTLPPFLKVVTVEGVAEYFEVSVEVIEKLTKKHSRILELEGFFTFKEHEIYAWIPEYIADTEVIAGKTVIELTDGNTFEVPKQGISFYSYEAILRLAMYLQEESVIAQIVQEFLIYRQVD